MTSAVKKIHLFANWKMYLDYDESNILANDFADKFKKRPDQIKIAVFPSALSLYPVGQVLRDVKIAVGAQNAYWVDKGGYTGEISAQAMKEAGCEYLLIGHSERRHIFGETNEGVRKKLESAIAIDLIPVVCVGETADERKNGRADDAIEIQLRSAFEDLNANGCNTIFIAYEPVWAIGTGDACPPKEAERMHNKIKEMAQTFLPKMNFVLLYGGSVRLENIIDYLAVENIDGVLIGNASAKMETFGDIYQNTLEYFSSKS
jgi:triosephosphate isomerase